MAVTVTHCPWCQHENPAAVKFCGECGARLEAGCQGCGAGNPPSNKFCHQCGAPLASRAPAPKFAAPDSYTQLRQALGRARAGHVGMRPLVAHCHLGLGKLYRRLSKREEAQEHLTTALGMYREMDMRLWLEQAAAEMAGPH